MSEYWIAQLLREAQSRNFKRRVAAEEELKKLNPDDVDKAVAIVDQWMIERERRVAWSQWIRPAMIIGQFGSMFALLFSRQPAQVMVVSMFAFAFTFGASICGEMVFSSISERRRNLLRPLNAADEHLTVARLIDHLGGHMYAPDRDTAARLTRLLPQVPGDNPDLISEAHRRRMYSLLTLENLYNCANLLFEIAAFAERTGDLVAYPRIKHLAESPAITTGAKRIRERARQCLATLEPLLVQAKLRDSLLRPANIATESSLLRPAGATPVEDSLLLRSAEQPDALSS